jgi:hypothetical protein
VDYTVQGSEQIGLWDAATGKLLQSLPGMEQAVFAPRGELLATGDRDVKGDTSRTVTLWRVRR